MKIAISGSSGFIGSALSQRLKDLGHEVIAITRDPKQKGIYLNISREELASEELEGVDAIFHLAGENVASARWSEKQKLKITESRLTSTRAIVTTINGLKKAPVLAVFASAVGFYGDRKEEKLDETSSPGNNFLSKLAVSWEGETKKLRKDVRCLNARFGLVLDKNGGALKKMLLPFSLGLGGRLGDGEQYLSWISLEDTISSLLFAMENGQLSGPVNIVSSSLKNSDFTKELASALKRPAFMHLSSFFLKLALGEMAEELLLSSQRVSPKKLLEAGFRFRDEDLVNYLCRCILAK